MRFFDLRRQRRSVFGRIAILERLNHQRESALGGTEMAKKSGSALAMWQGTRRCAMHMPPPAHAVAISRPSYSG